MHRHDDKDKQRALLETFIMHPFANISDVLDTWGKERKQPPSHEELNKMFATAKKHFKGNNKWINVLCNQYMIFL